MAIDPLDLEASARSLNVATGHARRVWLLFVSLSMYLVVTVGAVTHRMLLLETPIKLPLLNIDLPLVAFFGVAPILFVIVHFFLLLQLHALSIRIVDYNALLARTALSADGQAKLRRRLDPFVFTSYLGASIEERRALPWYFNAAIAAISVAIAPIIVLLQIQIVFLPYHLEFVSWVHRLLILIDIVLISILWLLTREGASEFTSATIGSHKLFFGCSIVIIVFSVSVATYPGERIYDVVSTNSNPISWISEFIFRPDVNEVTGKPRGLFSNILVLPDQRFADEEKIDKPDVTIILRGRDLRGAYFVRADLRKIDFSGANLNDARLMSAKLDFAKFNCADRMQLQHDGETLPPSDQSWPSDGCTFLQRAVLTWAEARGASFWGARMQGAFVFGAQLIAATFTRAQLEATVFANSDVRLVSFEGANLLGATFAEASAELADFRNADFRGAELTSARLQGARLARTNLRAASLKSAFLWRARGNEEPTGVGLADLSNLDLTSSPVEPGKFDQWKTELARWARPENRQDLDRILSIVDPGVEVSADAVPVSAWNQSEQVTKPEAADLQKQISAEIVGIVCTSKFATLIVERLIIDRTLEPLGAELPSLIKAFSDPERCPGAKKAINFRQLEKLVSFE